MELLLFLFFFDFLFHYFFSVIVSAIGTNGVWATGFAAVFAKEHADLGKRDSCFSFSASPG